MRCILTIAGSDPSGGAGLQGDLATFRALGVHGLSVPTALTVQNSVRVRAAHAFEPEWIGFQLEALSDDFEIAAVKTGVLFGAPIVEVVRRFLDKHQDLPVVVDPVLEAGGGGKLAEEGFDAALRELLLPRATLVTPNLVEAAALTDRRVDSPERMAEAARALVEDTGAGAALVKGGHLSGEAVDVLFRAGEPGGAWDEELVEYRDTRIQPGGEVHGTGCALSSAVTARLALGDSLQGAVEFARAFVRHGIQGARRIGKGALFLDHEGAGRAVTK